MAAIKASSTHPATRHPATALVAAPVKVDIGTDVVLDVLVGDDVVGDMVLNAVILGPSDAMSSTSPGGVAVGLRAELGDNAAAGAVAPVGSGATVGGGGVERARMVAPSRW